MKTPYTETINNIIQQLKKEERRWLAHISMSKAMIEKMETFQQKLEDDDYYGNIYRDCVADTRRMIQSATGELESVRRNIESISHLHK